jgi:hypothetical protein
MKTMQSFPRYVKGNKGEYRIYHIDSVSNGAPRYVIWFGSLGLPKYESSDLTRECGLKKYRAKWFGGGYVFESYNVDESLKKFEKIFEL